MVHLVVQTYALPKAGNRVEEYEDAWAYDERSQRLALADGASDGFESRLWAKALVQSFVDGVPQDWLAWLESPIQIWKRGIHWDQLPWYAEEKARRGAFATLLGVSFTDTYGQADNQTDSQRRWQASALGDACLFLIHDEQIFVRFPLEQSTDFGTTPALLSSRIDYDRRVLSELKTLEGICYPGDRLILATDALAAWFLREDEAGARPWQSLQYLDEQDFAAWVDGLRHEGLMRNDDVTLVTIRVEESKPASPPNEE